MNKTVKMERWIFDSFQATPQGLAFFRILFALFTLFFLLPDTSVYSYLSSLPADFYTPPPGPMMLLNEFPPEAVFLLLHSLLFLSLLFVLIGFETKKSSVAVGIFMLSLKGLTFGVGKINHDLLISILPIIMAFSNWGVVFSVDAIRGKTDQKAESWPLTLLALIIGFMMFTAGFPKILGGWLDPATQATEGHFLNQFFNKERQALLAEYIFYMEMDSVWELMDWGTIIFEIGFLFSVLNPRWFRIFVCLAVIFHVSTLMILNIAFLFNYMAYAAFLDWTKIYHSFEGWLRNIWHIPEKHMPLVFGGILLIPFSVISIIANADKFFTGSEIAFYEFFFSMVALLLVVYFALNKVRFSLNRMEVQVSD